MSTEKTLTESYNNITLVLTENDGLSVLKVTIEDTLGTWIPDTYFVTEFKLTNDLCVEPRCHTRCNWNEIYPPKYLDDAAKSEEYEWHRATRTHHTDRWGDIVPVTRWEGCKLTFPPEVTEGEVYKRAKELGLTERRTFRTTVTAPGEQWRRIRLDDLDIPPEGAVVADEIPVEVTNELRTGY